VHQHERAAIPADRIAKPRSPPLVLALLESLQPVFAVCHP
jgi:hypothetical protein